MIEQRPLTTTERSADVVCRTSDPCGRDTVQGPDVAQRRAGVAEHVSGGHDVRIDDGEVRAHRWTTPVAALEARAAGDFELAPPTVVTLHQLAGFGRAVDALAHPHRPEVFESQLARHDGPRTLLWHGDVGYGGGDPAAEGPRHRLVMTERWTYERTI